MKSQAQQPGKERVPARQTLLRNSLENPLVSMTLAKPVAPGYDSMIVPPLGHKWLQQQMPACRPVFTAISTFVGFLILGVAFLILGAVFIAFSSQVGYSVAEMESFSNAKIDAIQ